MPVAYGIKKLQISCKVEDEKCGTDFLEEKITEIEDLVSIITCILYSLLLLLLLSADERDCCGYEHYFN